MGKGVPPWFLNYEFQHIPNIKDSSVDHTLMEQFRIYQIINIQHTKSAYTKYW